jgi:hypothetical protein
VLVNVVIAVLLDEFGKAAASTKNEDGAMTKSHSMYPAVGCPLVQLAMVVSKQPTRHALDEAITALWTDAYLDAGGSPGTDAAEASMDFDMLRKGLLAIGFIPTLEIKPQDWANLVEKQGLATNGQIALSGFKVMVKQALRRYAIRELSVSQEGGTGHWSSDMISATTLATKILLFDREELRVMSGSNARMASEAAMDGVDRMGVTEARVTAIAEIEALYGHVVSCNERIETEAVRRVPFPNLSSLVPQFSCLETGGPRFLRWPHSTPFTNHLPPLLSLYFASPVETLANQPTAWNSTRGCPPIWCFPVQSDGSFQTANGGP